MPTRSGTKPIVAGGEAFGAAYDRIVYRCWLWPDSSTLYPLGIRM